MSERLPVEISTLAAGAGEQRGDMVGLNRPKTPGAIRAELERSSSLIALRPEIGTRARNIRLPGVRRLHLGRIRYDLYDPLSRHHDDWNFRPCGMPAVEACRQSDRSAAPSSAHARRRRDAVGQFAAQQLEVGVTPSFEADNRARFSP